MPHFRDFFFHFGRLQRSVWSGFSTALLQQLQRVPATTEQELRADQTPHFS